VEPIFRSADLEIYPSLAKVFVLEPVIPKPDFDGLRPSTSYTLDDIQAVHPTVLWQVEKMFKKEGRVRDAEPALLLDRSEEDGVEGRESAEGNGVRVAQEEGSDRR
jgi:hypothetical protein